MICRSLKPLVTIRGSVYPLNDLGMPHYSQSGHRWTGIGKLWNEELNSCKESDEKEQKSLKMGIPEHWNWLTNPSSWGFKFPTTMGAQVKNTMKGAELYFPNVPSSKPWYLFASVVKRGLRRISEAWTLILKQSAQD
ncbi:hypothetical protein F0562_001947 [Nyssa sinensis]|uniref:Uncharacterized protein n=1 Tax=Nyssa sinensis TaxID=561372 RepID=A0A5J5C4E2_9ASTE|nr:hypothetical protein F0562_001947 [Nyssa sinensis]